MVTTKITSGTFDVARIPDLATTKITSGTFDILRIPDMATTKITSGIFDILRIPDMETTKITSGTFDILRIPDLSTGKITSGTFDIARITDMATTKITLGTFDDARIPSLPISKITDLQAGLDAKHATLTSASTVGVFNPTQFVNNVGTGKINIDVNWKPTTAGIADSVLQLATSRNITGVGFNGTTSIGIPYFNLDFKPTAGTGITITAGSATTSPVISGTASTPTSASLIGILNTAQFTNNTGTSRIDTLSTWKPNGAVLADTATILATSRNIAGVVFNGSSDISISYNGLTTRPWISPTIFTTFDNVYTSKRVRIGTASEALALLHLTGNAKIGGTILLENIGNTANIELVRGLTSSTTDFNWNILNDNSLRIQNKTSTNSYVNRLVITSVGRVGIGGEINSPVTLLHLLGTSTTGGGIILDHIGNTPTIDLIRGLFVSTTDFNWRLLNDNNFKIQNRSGNNAFADIFTISSAGPVSTTGAITLGGTGALTITGGVINSGATATTNLTLNGASIIFQSSGGSDTTQMNITNLFGTCVINYRNKTGVEPDIGRIITSPTSAFFDVYKLQPVAFRISNFSGTINRRWDYKSDGTCTNALNATTWNTTSDHRVKENIKKADLNKCYDNVKNINVYRYNYIKGFKNNLPDNSQLGFITQQVKQHFPKSVLRNKTTLEDKREVPDLASVNIDQLNFTLFGAVKQLIRVVEKPGKHIKKLEEMLNIIDDDEIEDDTDEPYVKMNCEDECDIDCLTPEPEGV